MSIKRSLKKTSKRLSKEQWLARSLEILSREGQAKLRIDALVKELQVTKGSFYWHFENRREFVKSLAEYWSSFTTRRVIDKVLQMKGDAPKKLHALMVIVTQENLGRYEVAMRSWASQNSDVARAVKQVDKQRLSIVRSLFAEMGFRGKELEMRARTFLVFQSMELSILAKQTREERLRHVNVRHAFFTKH